MAISQLKNLTIFSTDQLGIADSLHTTVDRFKSEASGSLIVTGQPGSGKTTTLFSIAHSASNLGYPVSIIAGADFKDVSIKMDTKAENTKKFDSTTMLPHDWNIHYVAEETENAWAETINRGFEDKASILVLTSADYAKLAVLKASERKRWIFFQLDTPFVGIDVGYNLRGWGLSKPSTRGSARYL